MKHRSLGLVAAIGLVAFLAACQPKPSEDTAAGAATQTPAAAQGAEGGGSAPAPVGPNEVAVGGSEAESNNTILEANVIQLNQAVEGAVTDRDDKDFFKVNFTGKVRDLVKVRMDNASTTLAPYVQVYDAERSQISYASDGTPGANLEFTMTMDPGADYYLEVRPYAQPGAYKLSTQAQNAFDAHEPNDDGLAAKAASFGQPIEGSVLDKKDHDWFKVSGNTADRVTVRLENLSNTLAPYVIIHDQNRVQVGSRSSGSRGAGIEVTFKTKPGEDFFIEVNPYGSSGAYRLHMAAAAAE